MQRAGICTHKRMHTHMHRFAHAASTKHHAPRTMPPGLEYSAAIPIHTFTADACTHKQPGKSNRTFFEDAHHGPTPCVSPQAFTTQYTNSQNRTHTRIPDQETARTPAKSRGKFLYILLMTLIHQITASSTWRPQKEPPLLYPGNKIEVQYGIHAC